MAESNNPEELDAEELEALAMTREELMAWWDAGVPAEIRRACLAVNQATGLVIQDCHFDWPWPASDEGP